MMRSAIWGILMLSDCKLPTPSSSVASSEKNAPRGPLDEGKVFYIADTIATEPSCDRATVRSIDKMPVDHKNPGRGTFEYKYEHVTTHPDATTVVYLPGGPGGGSIGSQDMYHKNFPGLNLILIDPRGVNCNNQGSNFFQFKELSTEQHAQDVLAVIQKTGIKNFIVYGISYGTLIGTVVAQKAEKLGFSVKALVLEGIMGSAFTNGNRQTYDVEFQALKADHPDFAKMLAGPNFPLGYSEIQFRCD